MPFLKKSRERRKIDEKETRSWALSGNGLKGIEKDFTCLGCDCFSTVENRGMPVVVPAGNPQRVRVCCGSPDPYPYPHPHGYTPVPATGIPDPYYALRFWIQTLHLVQTNIPDFFLYFQNF